MPLPAMAQVPNSLSALGMVICICICIRQSGLLLQKRPSRKEGKIYHIATKKKREKEY